MSSSLIEISCIPINISRKIIEPYTQITQKPPLLYS